MSERTVEAAIKEFGILNGDATDACISMMLRQAKDLGGIEVAFPDWPEADEAAKRHPSQLRLSAPRGPNLLWRRLEYIGGDA